MAEQRERVEREPTTEEELLAATVGELVPLSGPIEVVDYDPAWPALFAREAARIRTALGERVVRLEHVGSTSVPELAAKPRIDILLVVADSGDEPAYVPALEVAGFRLVIREPDWYQHRVFKGPDIDVNLHVFSAGCLEVERMLRFRDHLRRHEADRRLYERTKRDLARQPWKYTQHYADAKTAVVEEILARARGRSNTVGGEQHPAVRFADVDRRGYRTTDVRTGYGEWVATYERTVEDAMDIALLETLTTPSWATRRRAADLGCGTGRTGAWLLGRGVAAIDGVDLTPEMLAVARSRGIYRHLIEADVAATGLPSAAYDLVTVCLVDEHLAELAPLYREAFRLVAPGGVLVLVAFHPHFIIAAGMPTHYTSAAGEPVAIDTHVHLLSDHVTAALAAGWTLAELRERVIDDAWIALKPSWEPFRGHPIAAAFVWRTPA